MQSDLKKNFIFFSNAFRESRDELGNSKLSVTNNVHHNYMTNNVHHNYMTNNVHHNY